MLYVRLYFLYPCKPLDDVVSTMGSARQSPYAYAATRIVRELSRYNTNSVLTLLLRQLHLSQPRKSKTIPMPWLLCRAMEIALEIQPAAGAPDIPVNKLDKVLTRLWDLQDIAFKCGHENLIFMIRRIIVYQNRFNAPKIEQLHFMERFYSILLMQQGKSTLSNDFEIATGLSFDKFIALSTWTMLQLLGEKLIFVKYEKILIEFAPSISPAEIALFLSLVGGTLAMHKTIVRTARPANRTLHASEYFEEPIQTSRPLILFNDGFSASHPTVMAIGLAEFVMRTLKSVSASFKDRFTKLFEKYIELLLKDAKVSYSSEADIQKLYRAPNEAPVVDFYIDDAQGCIFIDAKGVEPKQPVLTTGSGKIIKDKLKDAHLKGTTQILECASKLNELGRIGHHIERRFGVVITHQDFYIFDAETLIKFVDNDTTNPALSVGTPQVMLQNILYCSVSDWEYTISVCKQAKMSLVSFVQYCVKRQKERSTQRFTYRMHIEDFAKEHALNFDCGGSILSWYRSNVDSYIQNLLIRNQQYWRDGKHLSPVAFMHIYGQFKLHLAEKCAVNNP